MRLFTIYAARIYQYQSNTEIELLFAIYRTRIIICVTDIKRKQNQIHYKY